MAARGSKRLKATDVERAKLAPGMYSDGDGLHLLVTESGTRRWVLLLHVGGKRRKLGLGTYPEVSLGQARTKTAEHRAAVKAGAPLPSQREEISAHREAFAEAAKSKTVEQTFAEFWPLRRARLRNAKHQLQWETTLATYAWPKLGKRPVADVRAGEIIAVLAPIWHNKPETASRLLQRLAAIFKHAILVEYRERANPCDGVAEQLGSDRKGDREQEHHRALPYTEVLAFLKQLRQRGGMASTRLCFEFLILTATRSGEARGAVWPEIDLDENLWTIPKGRMKADKAHCVPLSDRAIEVLREARTAYPEGDVVFPGRRGQVLSDMTLTKALRDMGLGDRATAHGFRSAFKTWAAETGVDDLVSEAALAHVDTNKVRAAYNRTNYLDERRSLMQRWADHCGKRATVEANDPSLS